MSESESESTKRFKILVIGCIVLVAIAAAFALAFVLAAPAGAQVLADDGPAGATCPPGNVKYEADEAEYSYTDNSATVSLSDDAQTVAWQPAAGYAVAKVCVKIGGPNGGWLIFPDPTVGTFTSLTYAISHVVLTTGQPTAVEVLSFTATPDVGRPPADYRPLVLFIVSAAALVFGWDVWRRYRQS